MDLELMKRLHRKVNIVVVIAKADSLTAEEVAKLKQNILNDIRDNDIQVSVLLALKENIWIQLTLSAFT